MYASMRTTRVPTLDLQQGRSLTPPAMPKPRVRPADEKKVRQVLLEVGQH